MPQRVETVEQFFERVNKREDAIEREMGIDGSSTLAKALN